MAVFKILKCPLCGYNRTESRPVPTGLYCPKCREFHSKGKGLKCPTCGRTARETGEPCPRPKRHPDQSPRLVYSEKWHIKRNGKIQAVSPLKSRAEAEDAAIVTRRAEGRSMLNRVVKTPWSTAADRFLEWADENVSASGAAMFRTAMNRLDEFFNQDRPIDEIPRDEVEIDYIRFRRAGAYRCRSCETYRPAALPGGGRCQKCREALPLSQVSDSTINRELTTIRRMFAKSVEWGLLETNALDGLRKLAEPDPVERVFSEDEISRLLAECSATRSGTGKGWAAGRSRNPYLRTIVVLALNTGMRKANCLGVKLADLNFESMEIRVTLVKKKKQRRLTIPMTPELHDELKAHTKNLRQAKVYSIGGYLFPSPRDPAQPMRHDANFGFEAALKRAGIKTGRTECFHTLRHTFATHFLTQMTMHGGMAIDGALKLLQEILAHTDIKTTQRYLHVAERHKTVAMAGFSITPPRVDRADGSPSE